MARIRSIKPETWTSSDFIRLSNVGRLLFIGLISNADDYGRLHANPEHLAHLICAQGTELDEVKQQLRQMAKQGMIVSYRDAGKPSIAIANWAAHQRVDHPKDSTIAPPRENSRTDAKPRPSRAPAHAPADRMDRMDRTDRIDRTSGPGTVATESSPQAGENPQAQTPPAGRGTGRSDEQMKQVSDVLHRVKING